MLGEQLKEVFKCLDTRTRTVALAIGATESLVKHVDMPKMPGDTIRQVLKNNTRNYFQTNLTGHVFDYHVLYQAVPVAAPDQSQRAANGHVQRLVVAGAQERYVSDLTSVAKAAGLNLVHIIPGVVCPINAFELAHPEEFENQIVALVEIGFKSSTICIVQLGNLMLNRAIQIGGHQMTSAIADEINISYAEAEGIKIGMPGEVGGVLEGVVSALGRELRASIDYFEHQQECTVSRIYVSGGSARSQSVIEFLGRELMTECVLWDPTSFCSMALPATQSSEVESISNRLGVAVGAAIAAL
jgi:type IV pilus assembly protein PilM